LHRVFPPAAAQHPQSNDTQQAISASNHSNLERVVELEKALAVAHEKASGLEAQKDQMTDTINDLRKRLDSSEGRIMALLSDNRPQRSFLARFFGR
jgi:septal ring factor EnvC (AmiA/AmiB activator)